VNYFGVTRTAQLTRVIVVVVLLPLAVVRRGRAAAGALPDWWSALEPHRGRRVRHPAIGGLLFFAFAGTRASPRWARRSNEPRARFPRASCSRWRSTVRVRGRGVTVLAVLGTRGDRGSTAPLADAAAGIGWGWTQPSCAIGAARGIPGAFSR
jgi:APA family basic amino acid/polyamine antiporter